MLFGWWRWKRGLGSSKNVLVERLSWAEASRLRFRIRTVKATAPDSYRADRPRRPMEAGRFHLRGGISRIDGADGGCGQLHPSRLKALERRSTLISGPSSLTTVRSLSSSRSRPSLRRRCFRCEIILKDDADFHAVTPEAAIRVVSSGVFSRCGLLKPAAGSISVPLFMAHTKRTALWRQSKPPLRLLRKKRRRDL